MNIKQTFKSGDWLKTEDLKGKVHTFQIGEFNYQVFKKKDEAGNETGEEDVTYFVTVQNRDGARLRLNVTNRTIIADLYGEETDEWAGKWINVKVTKVRFGGKTVDGIAVDSIVPSATDISAAKAEAETADAPF